ncbi:MAG: 4a-hydroxytetrahydrobiopterin dehydratase [bacterium]|nr:4a-hydroxytetrahydrobiopterin dehydratase [bacterium]
MENPMELSTKKCTPCRGGVPPLEGEKLRDFMKQINGWLLIDEKKIQKKFIFSNFIEAIDFVNEAGRIAEYEGHHPDLFVHYNEVTVYLWTHKINGLYDNDFIMAAKIDGIRETELTFSAIIPA